MPPLRSFPEPTSCFFHPGRICGSLLGLRGDSLSIEFFASYQRVVHAPKLNLPVPQADKDNENTSVPRKWKNYPTSSPSTNMLGPIKMLNFQQSLEVLFSAEIKPGHCTTRSQSPAPTFFFNPTGYILTSPHAGGTYFSPNG